MKSIIFKVFLLLAVFVITSCKTPDDKLQRPNFLFITCEDISPDLSFYGDSTAKTPNLDQLANESMIYDNAFTTVAVCSPSRSSIITGMYPVSIGTHNMRTGGSVSGWGLRHYKDLPEHLTDPEGTPFTIYSAAISPEIRCFTNYLREAGYFCTNNVKTDYQFAAPLSSWDENSNKAHFNNRKAGQPFLAIFNFGVTHESQIWRKAGDSLRIDPQAIELPSYIPDFEQSRIDFARNYSNIEELDGQVGELLNELRASGEYENTYIFFFSDHGGPLPRGKRAIYDSGLKVPFLIRFPGLEITGRTDQMISFTDIAPTVLSLAGIEIPEYIQGKAFLGKQEEREREYIFGSADRFDELYDRVRCVRNKDYLLVKNYYPDQPRYLDVAYRKSIPMMPEFLRMRDSRELNETQMLWFNPTKPEIEFYDVHTDPEQVNDLAHLPEYQDEIRTMLEALENWQKEIDDKGGVPEAQLILQMWPGMVQPFTALPEVEATNEGYAVSCPTTGSDIVFRYSNSAEPIKELDHWQLYTGPIEKREGQYLHIRSTRIGYVDSEAVIVEM
jgi:arylsulfatase A-like enzyme